MWRDEIEELADALPGVLDGSFLGFFKQGFEFCEGLLDGIEVGRIGRQEEELGSGSPDRGSDGGTLVAAEVVHDHDIAGLEAGDQQLLDIGAKAVAVDGAVEDTWRGDPVNPERSNEGQGAPSPLRHLGEETSPPPATTVRAGHIGLGPGLIDEDQTPRVEAMLILAPLPAPADNVRAILFAGAQGFF